ncbi:DUF4214 domain-containing protein [Campylobacter rectus]|uniref:Putative surface layer protein n=4 Tax=Campylobacter rectus TaxID=203 RepID=A0A6G5QLB8_CAMRE|nr:DUF4214 domain-containing protein [Campylobacter rectus]QCD46523.1 putative surface layer protein [Campylobacter rectus]UEB47225.1 DUF4214 domain-containing protein [Campylobacter rectus]
MSITSIDISALYITMFNRVPEGAGHKFWFNLAKKQGLNTSQVAQQMLNSAPAQEYFAGKNSNEDFVNHIYSNLFGKTIAQDPKGSKFWIDKLKEGNSKAFVVSEMLKAAMSNTYTKPEELKAQKLFLNKLKAAEIAHKAIENVPSSGSITEKIASFANILKNIKDTSTPTQIAQVIKQEALKGNLTVLNSHQLAQITKSIFPSVDADALQKALDNTTATTDIYEEGGSTPTPPTPPAPTPNPGGGSSGGSNNPKPLTPEEQKQKAKEEAVKQAEENLQKAKEAAEQAKKDADIAKEIKDAVEHAINNHNGIKQYALNHIQNKIDDPSTTDKQREALEKAKDIVNTFGRTLDDKKLTEVTGEAEVADKTKDVAGKQKDLAQDQVEYAKAIAKEIPLFNAAQKAYDAQVKAKDEKAIADLLQAKINAAANISKVKSDIETSSLTYQQKIAAKAQLEVWTKELNLKDLDAPNNALKDKANENKQAADTKAAAAAKAYQDGPDKGALPDYTKNKDAITNFSAKVAKAKAAVASATVALRDAEVKAAKANLDKDPDNEELKETWEKAKAQLEKAKAEEKSAGAMAKAAELDATVLKKVGDTNVYKSEDGKYTVDLGNDKVTEGKTLVASHGGSLHEIDENSANLGANAHDTKSLLKSNDKGGTVYKNGIEQFSFISKDGNAVAALDKDGTKGFILKPGVKADYDTMSKATFDAGKFEANGAEQQTYKIETVKIPLPHNPDNPQYKITQVKDLGGAGKDYVFEDRPILDGALDFQVKDMGVVKVPVINGKIYAGKINEYDIDTDANNILKSITKTGTKEAYNFDADGKVESIQKGDFTYTLKEDGHKTLAEAVGLAAAGAQDALNKASSSVVYNIVGHSYKLKDGKVEKIDLKNGTELTVKAPADFVPNIDTLRNMEISKMKFADTPAEFTLTDNPPYGSAQLYEKVAGKFLLKYENQYKNSVYEDGTHKFTVTDAGENKYTLTETKDGEKVSEEKLENGILKTVKYEADGTTVKSVDIVDKAGGDNDTVTVDTEATSVANTKNVNVANVNNGKVNLAGIEKVEIKPGAELNAKGLDTLNKNQDIKEITLGGDLTLKSANGGNIDLGKVKDGGHNLNVDVTNNAKSDTIKFGTEIAGDKLNINGFEQTQDKVDFSALGATEKGVNKVASDAGKELENGKIYTTDVAGDIAGKNYGGADFGELFGDGKAFKTAAAAEGKSIVAVKGNDVTKVYQVNDADKNGTIDAGEVKLVGTFNSGVALEDANIA